MRDISVVIPCRNGAAFLAQTIRSVLNQTVAPREILIVDDGSRDESRAIAEHFGPPVRVLSGPARGASAARRIGAEATSGGRVMFLDADDLLTPPTLAALGAALVSGPGAAVALCPWDRYELEGEAWLARPPSAALPRPGQDALATWLTGTWSPPAAVLWTRAGYTTSGGWDPASRGDDDGNLMRRAMARGVAVRRTEAGLALYRRLPGERVSLSGERFTEKGLSSRLRALADTRDELARVGRLERYRSSLAEAVDGLLRDAAEHEDVARAARRLGAGLGGGTSGAGRRLGPPAARLVARIEGWRRPVGERLPAGSQAAPPPPPPPLRGGPLVSVIVPTFNRAQLVERAARSVLEQTYADVELLVVDDGSTDDTSLRLAALSDRRLRVIGQPNGGVARARNRGLAEARGRYIAFLDSDDWWRPEKLSHQVAALEAAPSRAGLCHTAVEIRSDAAFIERRPATAQGRVFEPLLLNNNVHAPTSSGVIRREVFDAVGGFDPALPAIEDWEWLQRVARLYDLLAIDLDLTVYREDESTPEERRSRNFRANMTAREMLWQRNHHALRRCGAAHLYLIESARRELRELDGDARKGRRLVLRALAERPQHRTHWAWLPYMATPFAVRRWLRRLDEPRHARRMGAEGPR